MTRGPKLVWEIVKYALGKPSIVGLGPTLVYCFGILNLASGIMTYS